MAEDPGPQRPEETYEPYEEDAGVPLPVIWIAVALAIWGGMMLYNSSESIEESVETRAQNSERVAGLSSDEGAILFAANCATCHQPDGVGLRDAVPPLAGSEIVAAGSEVVSRILLRGIDGPLAVAGGIYNGHMPSFVSVLDDSEIARIAGYVTARWGDDGPDAAVISPETVAALRIEAQGKPSFDGGAELAALVPGLPPAPPAAAAPPRPDQNPAVTELVFAGRKDLWACASCHGDLGQGDQSTPRLAGLPADYIAKQLRAFVVKTRVNESMQIVASALSEDEMMALGQYYAALRVPSNAQPVLSGNLARGEELALRGDWTLGVPACFSCHGSSGFGVAPQFPTLAAQHAPYTALQLAAWVGGERHNDPLGLMRQISEALSTQDRRAIADYLASLPPVPATDALTVRMEIPDER